MMPGVAVLDFLAAVTLDSVAFAVLGIDGVAQLHVYGLALSRAGDGRSEEAVCAIRDSRFHRFTDDLGNEHARAQAEV